MTKVHLEFIPWYNYPRRGFIDETVRQYIPISWMPRIMNNDTSLTGGITEFVYMPDELFDECYSTWIPNWKQL